MTACLRTGYTFLVNLICSYFNHIARVSMFTSTYTEFSNKIYSNLWVCLKFWRQIGDRSAGAKQPRRIRLEAKQFRTHIHNFNGHVGLFRIFTPNAVCTLRLIFRIFSSPWICSGYEAKFEPNSNIISSTRNVYEMLVYN